MAQPKPIRDYLTGAALALYGKLPKLRLPGDEVLFTPFIKGASDIIEENRHKPELAPHLFRRDCIPVYPNSTAHRLEPMKPEYFVSWTDRHFATYKVRYAADGSPGDVIKPMTKDTAASTLASHEFRQSLPPIERIFAAPVPVISPDGQLRLCSPGYEESTASYVFPSPFPYRKAFIQTSPLASGQGYYDDKLTLRQAVTNLHDLHRLFPFSDWEDPIIPSEDSPFHDPEEPQKELRLSRSLAVQIMGMLAFFAGGCIPQAATRLGFIFNANKQRSGKSLLAKFMVSPIFGSFKGGPWREKEEEMQKLLDSEILAASPYISFDNVRGLIASQPLETFMTSPSWAGRILGKTESFVGQNNTNIIISGNNCSVGADMQERLLIVDLYVEAADRQARGSAIPKEDVRDDVWLSDPENRRTILSSLWAIVRHWDAAGRPLATGQARAGFEVWCNILGGMVEFAGFGDPLTRPALENCGDSETDDFEELVRLASDGSRHTELTFQGVIHILWEHGLLPWCIHGREEYSEELKQPSFILNHSANSKLGQLLLRNCSGEKGSVHAFSRPDGTLRRVRVYLRGKGRHRRFHFDEITAK